MVYMNNKCLNQFDIGDIIKLGNYHGDIEWLVIDKCDNKFLVVSREVIESLPYDSTFGACFWEFSSLREWLNNSFIKEAFSEDEQKIIEITKVIIDDGRKSPIHSTKDKIFLLSLNECIKYLYQDRVKKVLINYLTENGVAKGLNECKTKNFWTGDFWLICLPSEHIKQSDDISHLPCEWWLRSTKHISEEKLKLYYNNDDLQNADFCCVPQIYSDGDYIEYSAEFELGVRPAMWISLE